MPDVEPFKVSMEIRREIVYDRQLFIACLERLMNKFKVERSRVFNSTCRVGLLAWLGEHQEISLKKIKDRYELTDATCWKEVDELLLSGYVTKVDEKGNARKKSVLITERGLELLTEWSKAAIPGWENYE